MTREGHRVFVRVRSLLASFALVVGCDAGSAPAHEAVRASPPPATRSVESAPQPLDYVERCIGAPCDSAMPLLITIHGLGDTPESFAPLYDGVHGPVRVAALRAPIPWGAGFAWFPYRAGDSDPRSIAAALRALVPRWLATIDAICARRECVGRPIVSGFSQGGMSSYALAALAPDRIRAAFPLGGFLPDEIVPIASRPRPTIRAWHGAVDSVVPVDLDQRGIERLRASGFDASLRIVPGVAHSVPLEVVHELTAEIDRALAQ